MDILALFGNSLAAAAASGAMMFGGVEKPPAPQEHREEVKRFMAEELGSSTRKYVDRVQSFAQEQEKRGMGSASGTPPTGFKRPFATGTDTMPPKARVMGSSTNEGAGPRFVFPEWARLGSSSEKQGSTSPERSRPWWQLFKAAEERSASSTASTTLPRPVRAWWEVFGTQVEERIEERTEAASSSDRQPIPPRVWWRFWQSQQQ